MKNLIILLGTLFLISCSFSPPLRSVRSVFPKTKSEKIIACYRDLMQLGIEQERIRSYCEFAFSKK